MQEALKKKENVFDLLVQETFSIWISEVPDLQTKQEHERKSTKESRFIIFSNI